jgi:hypothetical protein
VVAARATRTAGAVESVSSACRGLCGPDLGMAGPSRRAPSAVAGRHGSGGGWFLRVNKGRALLTGRCIGQAPYGFAVAMTSLRGINVGD